MVFSRDSCICSECVSFQKNKVCTCTIKFPNEMSTQKFGASANPDPTIKEISLDNSKDAGPDLISKNSQFNLFNYQCKPKIS